MSSIYLRLLVLSFLTLSSSAIFAQETVTEKHAADELTAEGLSMGQPPVDGVGLTYNKNKFGLWEQRCVKTAEGNDPCQLYQLLKDSEGTSVAEINMFSLPENNQAAMGATVIVPLETMLTAGLRFGIDTAEPKVYPFTFCTQIGCVARIGFTTAELAAFKKGTKGILTIVPAVTPNETVVLDVSLKGFTDGFKAVKAWNDALPKQ